MPEKNKDPYENMTPEQKSLLEQIKEEISVSGMLNGLTDKRQDELYQLAKNTALDLLKNKEFTQDEIVSQTEKYISEKVGYEIKK